MTNPTIDDLRAVLEIAFEQKVANIVKIGAKGAVLYVSLDATQTDAVVIKTFTSALSITGVSDAIKAQIRTIFEGGVTKVISVSVKTDFDSAVNQIKQQKFNWLCSDVEGFQDEVKLYAKENKCFAVCYDQTADSMYVVNFTNPTVTLKDGTEIEGFEYVPRLAGALAGLPYSRSASSIIFTDLKEVELPADADVNYGQFILENAEDGVRVVAPVNSLTTLTTNITEDMKSIAFVEGMKRIFDDIRSVFKIDYKGHYKNHYNNQCLFFSAVLGYLKKLVKLEILDPNYKNVVGTDVELQRDAWLEVGKDEAADWSDEEVKNNSFKKDIFMYLDTKILDAIEGLRARIALF